MSVSILERLGVRTIEQPIREFTAAAAKNSLQGWVNKEETYPQTHPLHDLHKGWSFIRRLDPSDMTDSQMSTHHLGVHQDGANPSVQIWFAGQLDGGWVISNVTAFSIKRNGDVKFTGVNGEYKISDGGNVHSFKPVSGTHPKAVDIRQLQTAI